MICFVRSFQSDGRRSSFVAQRRDALGPTCIDHQAVHRRGDAKRGEIQAEKPAVRVGRWLAEFTADDLAAAQGLTGDPRSRATHVVEEMVRVRAAVTALRAHDLVALGRLLDASHASSRDLYAVSCPELDVITEAARECDGVFGARLTGAGFGGCAVALVRPGSADEVRAHVEERFEAAFGCSPDFHLLRAGPGPAELGSG